MSRAKQPFIVGLTGNIGTGKSTVLHYLAQKGADTIDADRLSHRVLTPGAAAYASVVTEFGAEILNPDGTINRPALGKVVFADATQLAKLESIVHPAVFLLAQQEIAATNAPVVILEAIKLLEAKNLIRLCNEIWVVVASPETQIKRLVEQRGMDEQEARKRMAAQSAQDEKRKQAQRVIDNDGTPAQLYRQLDQIWEAIT